MSNFDFSKDEIEELRATIARLKEIIREKDRIIDALRADVRFMETGVSRGEVGNA